MFLRVFLPFAVAYCMCNVLRVVNAVIAPYLQHDLGLDAAALGLLTSSLFISFAAFQLPLGLLLDRYGPGRVQAALMALTAGGALLFAFGATEGALVLARVLIGVGTSGGLMAGMKASVNWFAPARLPLANGGLMAAGALGAIIATTPVEVALRYTDWRGVFDASAAVSLVIAVLILLAVPREPARGAGGHLGLRAQLAGVAQVLRDRRFWLYAPLVTASQATSLSVQGLWAGPWLADVAGLAPAAVAQHLLVLNLAMIAGFLGLGALAGRVAHAGLSIGTQSVVGLALFLLPQVALVAGASGPPALLWMSFGFLGTSGILLYAELSHAFPPYLAGRVITCLNVVVFVVAFLLQWGMGALIGLWPGAAPGVYAATGYRFAFAIALALQVGAFAWYLICRRRVQTAAC